MRNETIAKMISNDMLENEREKKHLILDQNYLLLLLS